MSDIKVKAKELLFAHPVAAAVIAAILIIALLFLVFGAASLIADRRHSKETEKANAAILEAQQKVRAFEDKEKVLQGEINSKDQQLERLKDALRNSDARVATAGQRVVVVERKANEVRNSTPVWIATDDRGKVAELRRALCGLYPNAESCH